ncbi:MULTISPECIES: hypothetical protein [Enterobacterales]|uniref:hypothetical protein n=1 Tax=Enterobacterales TaxID=91347 RepID=UPI0015B76024|nr:MULTISPECIES: hypothetical protein [Enterobacterales]EFL6960253.1 hypothetical protein [Salmonella enterica subsp. enterica serovar Senftenberg]EFX3456587.1 hypothetical protein [Salmonella enterica subsp. enterica serovar London]EHB0024089.1 hypothetical protein [Salmonella enterica subsp. enterica serovar Kedougou]EJD8595619.1 hypothetical protein [Salmonella enterica]ELK5139082.1 hypothetical protein [Salmonella enterica subsp. enterica serovar Anatum]ELM3915329.1 hypothetical protein [
MSVQRTNMTTARIAPELVITAPNNAERWPPEKKIQINKPASAGFFNPVEKIQQDEIKSTSGKWIYS